MATEALSKAFSGLGIEEKSLITILGRSNFEEKKSFRKENSDFFREDERLFEIWNDHHVKHLKREFMRFKNAVVLLAMHPWERDARLIKESLKKGPGSYGVIVEIACTRSSEELLGARKAYHALFDHSVEEDVASHINGDERKLLVALVSAYRYEGPKVKDDTAKSEAKTLSHAIKNSEKLNPIKDDELIRILTTRSKLHIKAVYHHYSHIFGTNIVEDNGEGSILSKTVECLCNPQSYFSKVLGAALHIDADKNTKKGLTRVVVTQADTNTMKDINDEYLNLYGVSLSDHIAERANGNYKDLLVTLVTRATKYMDSKYVGDLDSRRWKTNSIFNGSINWKSTLQMMLHLFIIGSSMWCSTKLKKVSWLKCSVENFEFHPDNVEFSEVGIKFVFSNKNL